MPRCWKTGKLHRTTLNRILTLSPLGQAGQWSRAVHSIQHTALFPAGETALQTSGECDEAATDGGNPSHLGPGILLRWPQKLDAVFKQYFITSTGLQEDADQA